MPHTPAHHPSPLLRLAETLWEGVYQRVPLYFDWIHVDPCSRVDRASPFHPAQAYAPHWRPAMLSFSRFTRLESVLPRTKAVFLYGWGDPFANPALFPMARLARDHDCQLATVTRGVLLSPAEWDRVVALPFDVVAFPIQALDEAAHKRRAGCSLEEILHAIHLLQEAKRRAGSPAPIVELRFLLTRASLDDLDALPGFLAAVGVRSCVAHTVSFVPRATLADECLLPRTKAQLRWLLKKLHAVYFECLRHETFLRYHVLSPGVRPTRCGENVTECFHVTASGQVAPCILRGMPLDERARVSHWRLGREHPWSALTFGDLATTSPEAIWRSKPYRRFRTPWYWNRPHRSCATCMSPLRLSG